MEEEVVGRKKLTRCVIERELSTFVKMKTISGGYFGTPLTFRKQITRRNREQDRESGEEGRGGGTDRTTELR